MSNSSVEVFVNKSECFINQYENISIPFVDVNVQGRTTLGENIADNGGLHHAFMAYRNYVRDHGADKKLPGFENFTNDQMFFIAFGSVSRKCFFLMFMGFKIIFCSFGAAITLQLSLKNKF